MDKYKRGDGGKSKGGNWGSVGWKKPALEVQFLRQRQVWIVGLEIKLKESGWEKKKA